MNTETINPEDLYSLYQKTRAKSTQSLPSHGKASIESLPIESDSLPAKAYRVYRESRNHDHEASVDAIMSFIHAEQSRPHPASPSVVKDRSEESLRSLSGNASSEKKGSFIRSLSRTFGNLSNVFGSGFVLPAMAAAVMAVVLIPLLSMERQSAPDIPLSMIDHAAAVVNLIEQEPAQSLGFSNALSSEKKAFGQGVLATDLSLAVIAQDQVAIENYMRQISLVVTEQDTRMLNEHLVLDGEPGLSEESREAVNNVPIRSELIDRSSAIHTLLSQELSTGEKAWFKLGTAIETIYAGAMLHQERGFTKALAEALVAYSSMEIPEPALPASKLLRQLQQLSADQSPENDDLSVILNLSRDIKVLML